MTASPAELGAGALDALAIGTLGEWLPGFLGLVSCSFMISTFNCAPETRSKQTSVLLSRHALVPGVFLWSSSVRRSRVRPGFPRLLFSQDKDQEKTDPFGDFRGRPH